MKNRDPRALTLLLALLAVTACNTTQPAPAPQTAEAQPPTTGHMGGLLEQVRLDDEIVVIRRGAELFEFRIVLDGDVLDPNRTNIRDRNGHRIPLAEIEIGTPVGLYWHTDADRPGEQTAKMIQIAPGLPRAPSPE